MKDHHAARMILGGTKNDDHERPKDDFYPTVPEATLSLLGCERFDGMVWEPACGDGAISRILEEQGYEVVSTDLYDHGFGECNRDFLTTPKPSGVQHIVTNPPFKIATEFAYRMARIVSETGGKGAFLQRLTWLEGIDRQALFESTCFARLWVFSRRLPRMHRPGYTGKTTTSMVAFAWFVWDSQHTGDPVVRWIDWQNFIGQEQMKLPGMGGK